MDDLTATSRTFAEPVAAAAVVEVARSSHHSHNTRDTEDVAVRGAARVLTTLPDTCVQALAKTPTMADMVVPPVTE